MNTTEFIGLEKRQSQNLAEKKNLIYRLVSVDGEKFLGYPEDTREDRICCEVERNLVVKAVIQ